MKLITLSFALISLQGAAWGQTSITEVQGFVRDAQNRAIEGARIFAGMSARASALSDVDGHFSLQLAPTVRMGDRLSLHIEKAGFRPFIKDVAVVSSVTPIFTLSRSRQPKAAHAPSASVPPGSVSQSNSGSGVNVQQATTGANSSIVNSPITIGVLPVQIPTGKADQIATFLKTCPKRTILIRADQYSAGEPLPSQLQQMFADAGWNMVEPKVNVLTVVGALPAPTINVIGYGEPLTSGGQVTVNSGDPVFCPVRVIQLLGLSPSVSYTKRNPISLDGSFKSDEVWIQFSGAIPKMEGVAGSAQSTTGNGAAPEGPCNIARGQDKNCTGIEILDWGKPLMERLDQAIRDNEAAVNARHMRYAADHNESALHDTLQENIALNRYFDRDYKNLRRYRLLILGKLKGGDPTGENPFLSLHRFDDPEGEALMLSDADSHYFEATIIRQNLTQLGAFLEKQSR